MLLTRQALHPAHPVSQCHRGLLYFAQPDRDRRWHKQGKQRRVCATAIDVSMIMVAMGGLEPPTPAL